MYKSNRLFNKKYYILESGGDNISVDSEIHIQEASAIPRWEFSFSKIRAKYNYLKFGNFVCQIYTPLFIFRKTEASIDFSVKLPTNKIPVDVYLAGEVQYNSEWHLAWVSYIGAGMKNQYYSKLGRLMTKGFSCA